MWEQFAQYGLVGLMVCGIYFGIAWAGVQLLGKRGILRENTKAIEGVTACLDKHHEKSSAHASDCADSNKKVSRLHRAATTAIDEIEAECKLNGLDVSDRCNRVRRELEGES